MKRVATVVIMLVIALPTLAQPDDATRRIDEQVWRPFIRHFESWNAVEFNALHTPDMIRGGPWGLRSGEQYLGGNLKSWPEGKASGRERDIAFTFEYRVVGDGVAYEVGYYRTISRRDRESRTSYGQFHVVLRQVDGVWKIAQDWDSNAINGRAVTEEDFLKNAENGFLD